MAAEGAGKRARTSEADVTAIPTDALIGSNMLTRCKPGVRLLLLRNLATGGELAPQPDGTVSIPRDSTALSPAGLATAESLAAHLLSVAALPGVQWARDGATHGMRQWTVSLDADARAGASWAAILKAGLDVSGLVQGEALSALHADLKAALAQDFSLASVTAAAAAWAATQEGAAAPTHLGLVRVTTVSGIDAFLAQLGVVLPPTVRVGVGLASATLLTITGDGQALLHTLGDLSGLIAAPQQDRHLTQLWNNAVDVPPATLAPAK